MCPSLIQIGSKTAETNSAQTNKQTNRHYENNGHLAVNQCQQRVDGIITRLILSHATTRPIVVVATFCHAWSDTMVVIMT